MIRVKKIVGELVDKYAIEIDGHVVETHFNHLREAALVERWLNVAIEHGLIVSVQPATKIEPVSPEVEFFDEALPPDGSTQEVEDKPAKATRKKKS